MVNESAFDEVSQMTETTGMSPITTYYEHTDNAADDFDPDLLRELGDLDTDPTEFGENLQSDVAARFQKILQEGMKKDIKEELLKKYLFPKNVTLAKSPTLNPEIGAILPETCKQRDKRLAAKQDQLGKALSALGIALTSLLKKNPHIPEVIRTLKDAGVLLADSHFAETDTRRSVIIPLVDKSLTDSFKDRKRDVFLFGEKLGDLVKDTRGIKRTGQLIQPSASNLNARGPPSRGPRQQRGGQTYQHRAGGPRSAQAVQTFQTNRRRATAQHPPPQFAPRRQNNASWQSSARRLPPQVQRPTTSRQS
ncbi:uncharacterized protein LOC126381061 [Pectinophora gossypiella]|uniref:uncharacterized protein LOC126381061 n=1 Tax=Pectinophora gossypiella TaxID=13191 RepID=UPI00214E87A0|nr:uncharacterized protein LOC126381061 [Pectinophora gossypiella]